MITLEQVRALETRVDKALGVIERLTAENAALRESADRENKRAAELERTVEEFRRDQARIERGILHALERLNAFEDAILESAPKAETKASESPTPHEGAAPPATHQPSEPATEKTAAPESASPAGDGASPESGTAEAELEIF